MVDIIKNIFRSFKKDAPKIVKKELLFHFPDALNIDWYLLGDKYEAIFYLLDVEHIARISKAGKLLEYKKNLWVSQVPQEIRTICSDYGEIMSAIEIYSDNETKFEIIIRDSQQVRTIFHFDSAGKLISTSAL